MNPESKFDQGSPKFDRGMRESRLRFNDSSAKKWKRNSTMRKEILHPSKFNSSIELPHLTIPPGRTSLMTSWRWRKKIQIPRLIIVVGRILWVLVEDLLSTDLPWITRGLLQVRSDGLEVSSPLSLTLRFIGLRPSSFANPDGYCTLLVLLG